MLENYSNEMKMRYAEWLADRFFEEFGRMQLLRRKVFGVKLAKSLDDYTLSNAKYFHTGIEPKRGRSKRKQRLTKSQKRQRK